MYFVYINTHMATYIHLNVYISLNEIKNFSRPEKCQIFHSTI